MRSPGKISAYLRAISTDRLQRERHSIRDGGAALADALATGRAVYQLAEPRLLNVALLGVAWQESPSVHSLPALYASLTADRLVGRDWGQMRADDLATVAGCARPGVNVDRPIGKHCPRVSIAC